MTSSADKNYQFVVNGGGGASKKQNSPNHSSNDSDISPQIQHHSTLGRKIYKRFYRKTFCAIAKHFFALLKNYKRYYLGKPRLKMCCYMFINNEQKASKWKQRHNNRYENISNSKTELAKSLRSYAMLRKLATQIEIWLNSKEFKEKYIDTNHPYPPLLNPNSIPYDSISAELAWEFNIPIPQQNYHLLNISNGLSASAATLAFFKECKVNVPVNSLKEIYNQLLQSNNNVVFFYFVFFVLFDRNVAEHFKYMLDKKVPLLYIARDPISKIRSLLNHISFRQPQAKFNLTFSYDELIPKETYAFSGDITPSFKMLENPTQNELDWLFATLACDSIFQIFKDNISTIHCVEFNELKGDKCADTFCRLAKMFNFDTPKNKDVFNNRIWNEMYYLFPTTLYAHQNDINIIKKNLNSISQKGGFEIIITLPSHLSEYQKDFIDISDEVEKNLVVDESKILIIINKDELKQLRANNTLYDKSIMFLRGYINAIKNEVSRRKSVLFDENQVLDFLKHNHKIRAFLKHTLDSELNYIKQNHPDFIKEWKYYNKFEKMCAQLDNK